MAESVWLRNRSQNFQYACYDELTGALLHPKDLDRFIRYENTYNRAFNNSLKQLLSLRAEKRKAEIGFEAQKQKQAAEAFAAEKHAMKKEAHSFEILKKDAATCHQIGLNLLQKLEGVKHDPNFADLLTAEITKERQSFTAKAA